MLQTENSPPIREVINITDSPERSRKKPLKNLRVMALPDSSESLIFPLIYSFLVIFQVFKLCSKFFFF